MLVNCQACGALLVDTDANCPRCGARHGVENPQSDQAQSATKQPLTSLRATWEIMRWAFLAFIAARTVVAVELAALIVLAELMDRGVPGAYDLYMAAAQAVQRWDQTLVWISAATFIASGIAYMYFVFRGLKKLRAAGAPYMEMSPGLGAWSILIPVAFWFVPYFAMKEIRQGAMTLAGRPPSRSTSLNLWWATWLVATLSGVILGYVQRAAESTSWPTIDTFRMVAYGNLFTTLAFITAGVIFIRATRRIMNAWDDARKVA